MKDSQRKAMYAKKGQIKASEINVADYYDYDNDDYGRQNLLHHFADVSGTKARRMAKRKYFNLPKDVLGRMQFNMTKGEIAVLYDDNGYDVV